VTKRLHTQYRHSARRSTIPRKAGKNGNIKLVKKAIKRVQGKHKKKRNNVKVARAQKAESSDSDSSDESIHVMEPGQRIPRKKRFAQRTIQFDYKGNQVDFEDSESDDDRKMPAKISRKKPKKVAEPMDTDSSEETDED
jgi:predicted RNA binding protein YcfA (HicA-like mRNA interferase family)